MITQMENDNRIILEQLSELLEKRRTYDAEFLKGIFNGEIIERKASRDYPIPGMPEGWSDNTNEIELEIRIPPDSYLARNKNQNFNEPNYNDVEDIAKVINDLNKIPNKKITKVTVKPQINDESFLGFLGEIIKSRTAHSFYFKSDFLNGFPKGKWKINQIEVPKPPFLATSGEQRNESKNELFIEIPFENYQHKINNDFKNDDDYILQVANEIKHFREEIYQVKVKPL